MRRFLSEDDRERFPRGFQEIKRLPRDSSKRFTRGSEEIPMTPPTDLHPEYGYLCPSPRLHRDARVAVISVLLGVIIGGIAVIALVADRDGHSFLSSLSSR